VSRPTLAEIFARYPGSDKGTTHSYLEGVYDRLLAPIRGTAKLVLEVGARDGSSLRAWRDYFPNATIFGLDNWTECPAWKSDDPRVVVWQADSRRPESLHNFATGIGITGSFDLIVDDGDHVPAVQVATYAALWPFVAPGGLYVIEDLEGIVPAQQFIALFGGEIIDLRHMKERHDDILVVLRKP